MTKPAFEFEDIPALVAQLVKDKAKKYVRDPEKHRSKFDYMTPEEYRFYVEEHQ